MKAGNYEIIGGVPFLDIKDEYIVLGYSEKDVQPYGIWKWVNGDTASSGSYFENLEEAKKAMFKSAAF